MGGRWGSANLATAVNVCLAKHFLNLGGWRSVAEDIAGCLELLKVDATRGVGVEATENHG